MEITATFLFIVASLSLILLVLLVWRVFTRREDDALRQSMESLRQEFSNSLAALSANLSERVSKSGADLRQEISDRMNAAYRELQERMERQLVDGRQEQSRSLSEANTAVMTRFAEFRTETETRLTALESKMQAGMAAGRKELQEGLRAAIAGLQSSLEGIRTKVDERLMLIGEQVQTKLDENIKEGFKHFEKVQEYLKQAELHLQSVGQLGTSINELSSILKLPHLRGRFGEATLERILADFLPAGSFDLQKTDIEGRPDAFVHLPNARLPIDSKFPRESILPLFESSDEVALRTARDTLRKFIKEQASSIGKYIRPDEGTAEIALMFLPSETIYFEVLRDTELCEHLYKSRVFPVSPNTLAITLKAIALSYSYYEMAKNVRSTIEEIKKAQRHFGFFEKQFGEVGSRLENAADAYRKAQTHLGSYKGRIGKLTGEELTPEDFEESVPAVLLPSEDAGSPSEHKGD